jgi:hypothetical protein
VNPEFGIFLNNFLHLTVEVLLKIAIFVLFLQISNFAEFLFTILAIAYRTVLDISDLKSKIIHILGNNYRANASKQYR